MGRRKSGRRTTEPHKHGKRWRFFVYDATGKRRIVSRASPAAARAARREIERGWGAVTTEQAIGRYRGYLAAKGNRAASISTTCTRLQRWVGHRAPAMLGELTPANCRAALEARGRRVAVDTVRNELAEVRTWLRWCVEQGWIGASPAETLKAVGRRRRGKAQLHVDEARRFTAAARRAWCYDARGWEGALGALLALWCGLRSGEICMLMARDVDRVGPGVVWLWVADAGQGKTDAARRRVVVDVPWLVEALLQLAADRRHTPGGWLFPSTAASGRRSSTWLRQATTRLCRAAGVPRVAPHGLRGTWGTLALGAGVGARAVADALGHEEVSTTRAHYLAPGSERAADQRAVEGVLKCRYLDQKPDVS